MAQHILLLHSRLFCSPPFLPPVHPPCLACVVCVCARSDRCVQVFPLSLNITQTLLLLTHTYAALSSHSETVMSVLMNSFRSCVNTMPVEILINVKHISRSTAVFFKQSFYLHVAKKKVQYSHLKGIFTKMLHKNCSSKLSQNLCLNNNFYLDCKNNYNICKGKLGFWSSLSGPFMSHKTQVSVAAAS